jgi:hypothetical protein
MRTLPCMRSIRKNILRLIFTTAGLLGFLTPALASTSAHQAALNTPALGSAAKHIKFQEQAQQERRFSAYRAWFYRKNGEYPGETQLRNWYYHAYGVYPS